MRHLDISVVTNYLQNQCRNAIPYNAAIKSYVRENEIPKTDVELVNDLFAEASKSVNNFALYQSILEKTLLLDDENQTFYILDSKTRNIIDINLSTLRLMFTGKAYTNIIQPKVKICKMTYDPNTPTLLKNSSSGTFKELNLYRPADWQQPYFFDGEPVPASEIPDVYVKYLKHLTGSSGLSYTYMLNYMASCVQTNRRAFTYCTLLSAQGVGKGVLFNILKALLGEKNVSYIKADKLADIRFNAFAKDKKLLFFDELTIRNSKDENAMKMYVNDVLEVEAKGQDSKPYTNYANIMVASNSLQNLKIEADDRRYSFVDMGKDKLEVLAKTVYNMSVNEYVDTQLYNPENIKQLGEFLLNFEIDLSMINKVISTAAKTSQRYDSLQDWEETVFTFLAPKYAGKELTLVEAKTILREHNENSKISPGRERWRQLAESVPGFFSRKKKRMPDGTQCYVLKFEKLQDQPNYYNTEKEE